MINFNGSIDYFSILPTVITEKFRKEKAILFNISFMHLRLKIKIPFAKILNKIFFSFLYRNCCKSGVCFVIGGYDKLFCGIK